MERNRNQGHVRVTIWFVEMVKFAVYREQGEGPGPSVCLESKTTYVVIIIINGC